MNNNRFNGIAAISASTIWAVGEESGPFVPGPFALIERWDGTAWNIVSSPNARSNSNFLSAIARVPGSQKLWTVGGYFDSGGISRTLSERWNGAAWSIVSNPNPGSVDDHMNGVVAISSSNIWAVGDASNDTYNYQTLIEHWNGTNWSVVVSPNAGLGDNHLLGVARIPGTERAWAVGDYSDSGFRTLTERYS